MPPYVNLAAAKLGHALGRPVFMDVGGTDAPLDEAILPYLDVIAPNESELGFISGVEIARRDDGSCDVQGVRRAVGALKAKFARVAAQHGGSAAVEILITLGAQGSIHFGAGWSDGGGEGDGGSGGSGGGTAQKAQQAHETHMGRFALHTSNGNPTDTTGAGDCYRGSYVGLRYGEGKSVAEAMRWAAAAAACSVEVEGAMPSMPPRAKIAERCAQPLLGVDGF